MSRCTRLTWHRLLLAAWLLGSLAGMARAEDAALVEEVSGTALGIRFMDYLATGQVVKLGTGDRLILDYLRSCTRETITGGTVKVGTSESIVTGGAVQRERVECDGGHIRLTADQGAKSGVAVFRSVGPKPAAGATLTLYGRSPLIDLRTGGTVTIERLDPPGEKRVIEIKPASGRAEPYDCAQHGLALTAGGSYRATAGGRQILFKIAEQAGDGMTPPVGRLIRF
jgi:hypothetical protein